MIESSSSSLLGTSPWNTDPFLWKDGTSFLAFENLLSDTADCLPLSSDSPDEDEGSPAMLELPVAPAPTPESGFADILAGFLEEDTCTTYGLDLDELSLDPTESSEVLSDWSGSSGWPAYDVGEDTADFGGHRSRERSRRGTSAAAADILESSSSKSWSLMSGEEQLRTVEALTEAISRQLGLREQLDVIRIINPLASVDPAADREFIVDLRHLDDRKLRQIADYVRRHAAAKEEVARPRPGRRSRRSTSDNSSSGSSNPSATKAPINSGVAPRTQKDKRKRHRREPAMASHQRKARRQMLKEQRSGLFVHEQVLSLSGTAQAAASSPGQDCPQTALSSQPDAEEDEEVDILH
uniref:Uncharacterized protein n=1 Tax=Ixodes ricinus TaxID=34613 RepID=V5GVT1_IXORI